MPIKCVLGGCTRGADSAACMAARDERSEELCASVPCGSKSFSPRRGRVIDVAVFDLGVANVSFGIRCVDIGREKGLKAGEWVYWETVERKRKSWTSSVRSASGRSAEGRT